MEKELSLRKAPQHSGKHVLKHQFHKTLRHERLENGIYGITQDPVLLKDIIGYWEPPSYLDSRQALKNRKHQCYINSDYRCFYLGVNCNYIQNRPINLNHDPKLMPWLATKDHLVPIRRSVAELAIDVGKYPPATVLSSNIANVTFGLSPLPVRLKIREWLSTSAYDRNDTSVAAGNNLRWLIIKMLNDFRINGRFPWSRTKNGTWWYPQISEPWMIRCCRMEQEFLELNEKDRDLWIKKFVWNF